MKNGLFITFEGADGCGKTTPVSYTHLDVYKRQQEYIVKVLGFL